MRLIHVTPNAEGVSLISVPRHPQRSGGLLLVFYANNAIVRRGWKAKLRTNDDIATERVAYIAMKGGTEPLFNKAVNY